MILLNLFLAFLRVGISAIGGANSFFPLLEAELVQNRAWLDKSEFLEVVGMAEVVPGAISIKFATYTGYKVAGVPGAVVANLGNLVPPVCLILIVSLVYAKYGGNASIRSALEMVRYAVLAMMIGIAIKGMDTSQILRLRPLLVIVISLVLFITTKIHPAFVILGAALYGGWFGRVG